MYLKYLTFELNVTSECGSFLLNHNFPETKGNTSTTINVKAVEQIDKCAGSDVRRLGASVTASNRDEAKKR